MPNFSQIGAETAEISLAEMKKENKEITAVKYKSSRTLTNKTRRPQLEVAT